MKDLEAGKPLEVLLRAAVLQERQNLDVRLRAAPLPPSLEPMLISAGKNSDIRYNFFYPRWAYDEYRRQMAERAAARGRAEPLRGWGWCCCCQPVARWNGRACTGSSLTCRAATVAVCLSSSLNHAPLLPYCANL